MAQGSKSKSKTIIDADDLQVIWKIFSKNWYFIIFFPLVAAVIAYLKTYQEPDIYASRTQILLKTDEIYGYQNQIYKQIGGAYGLYGDITNQKRVLSSYDLIKKSLTDLDFEVSYFIAGRVKTTEYFEKVPFKIEVDTMSRGLYEKPIEFKIVDLDHYRIIYERGDGNKVDETYVFGEKVRAKEYAFTVHKTSSINAGNIDERTEVNWQFVVHRMNTLVNKYKRAMQILSLIHI